VQKALIVNLHVGRLVDGIVGDKKQVCLSNQQRADRRRLRGHVSTCKRVAATTTIHFI